ncbi:hypothetical protein [Steroidobacter cummioxidans]|uniref:hypothetical protein n=1 Tax=Steroidobacter cummioxidans TaxID=1803913 RepID=UPI000E30E7EA|nr:hypothetical protein [Steroidobacter cummioxidans]
MRIRPLLLALFVVFGSGCINRDTLGGKSAAEPEVKRFHDLLKEREFEAMYAATGQQFKSAVPKNMAIKLFSAIDRKLGPLQQTKQVNWNVNTHNLVTTVALVYQSRFESGEATETFTFHVLNGKPELIGYNIASLDMLIK